MVALALYTVYIEYMYREAGGRRRVYFNPQHAYMHTRGVQPKTWAWPGTNTGKCILGNHLSLVFHNGGNLGPMHSF